MSLFLNLLIAASVIAASGWETITIYWNDLSREEQQEIVVASYVPSNVRSYYYRTEKPSDDKATFDVLKTVTTISPPWQKRALYLHTFVRIMNAADGALGEPMGGYCLKILKSDPEYVMYYLNENEADRKHFAEYIASDFYQESDPGAALGGFRKWLSEKFAGNPDLGQTVGDFRDEVEFALSQM